MARSYTSQPGPLAALLASEGTTVAMVLDDSGFTTALRQASKEFCDFFTRDENVDAIFDIAFTPTPDSVPETKRARQAVTTLTTKTRALIGRLAVHERLKERLNKFPGCEFCGNTKSCGYFQKILESFASFTNGEILADLPEIRPFLVKNLNCLALRDLFVNLVSQFPQAMGADEEMFVELVREMREHKENAYLIVTAILALWTLRPSKVDMGELLGVRFVEELLGLAVERVCPPVAMCYAFQLLVLIAGEEDSEVLAKIREFEDKFSIEGKEMDAVTMQALKLFRRKALECVDSMFEAPAHTFLNEAIIGAFKGLNDQEKNKFVEDHKLAEKIMQKYEEPAHKSDGVLTGLAVEMNGISAGAKTGALAGAEWTKFFNEKVKPRLARPDSEAVESVFDEGSSYSDSIESSESSEEESEYEEDESSSDGFQVKSGHKISLEDDAEDQMMKKGVLESSSDGSEGEDDL